MLVQKVISPLPPIKVKTGRRHSKPGQNQQLSSNMAPPLQNQLLLLTHQSTTISTYIIMLARVHPKINFTHYVLLKLFSSSSLSHIHCVPKAYIHLYRKLYNHPLILRKAAPKWLFPRPQHFTRGSSEIATLLISLHDQKSRMQNGH